MTEQEVQKAADTVLNPDAHSKEETLRLQVPTGATESDGQPVIEEREIVLRYRPMPIKWAKMLNTRLEKIQTIKSDTLSEQLAVMADMYTEVMLLMCEYYRLAGVNREVLELSFEDSDIVKLVRKQAEVQSADSFLLKLLRMLLVSADKMMEYTDMAQTRNLEDLEKRLLTTPSASPGASATPSLSNGILLAS